MAVAGCLTGEMGEGEERSGIKQRGKEREERAGGVAPVAPGARDGLRPGRECAAAGSPRPARALSRRRRPWWRHVSAPDYSAKIISSSELLRILFGTKSSWNFMKIFVDIGEEYI